MSQFNLRRSHDRRVGFDLFLGILALFGAWMMWIGFSNGGGWIILGILALIGEVLLAYGIFIEPERLIVARHRIGLVREPTTWLRVVFLSDMHTGGFHSAMWYERIAREASALNPDLVLLGGDYVVDLADPIAEMRAFQTIPTRLGKYFVLGNHDMPDRPQDIRTTLTGFGYEDLTNRAVTIERNGKTCELQGVDDCWQSKPQTFTRSSTQVPHITLSHEPDLVLDLKEGDTDLVLIGHTHGGQVRLPTIGALWPIPSRLGRALDRGRKIMNGIPCIVSNGLGETDGRLRLFSPPEIVVVDVGV